MAADNVTANPGSGGASFRTFSDGTNEWPASVISWVTGGSPGAWTFQQVTNSNGLPVSVLGTATVAGTVTANQGGTWTVATNADAGVSPGTPPSKALVMAGVYNATPPVLTNGQSGAIQMDSNGRLGIGNIYSCTCTIATQPLDNGPVAPGTAATKSSLMGGQYNTSLPGLTNGQQAALQCDSSGRLIVTAASGNVIANQGSPPWSIDITQIAGGAIALGQTTMQNSLPVALASNQTQIPVSQNGVWTVQPGNNANTTPWLMTINQGGNSASVTASNALKVDGSAVTQPVSGTVTANAGTGNFTVVQPTAANLNATVTGTVAANPAAAATGGATPYHLVSAATTNATSVKGSSGTVYDMQCFNTNAEARFLKFYDKATAPTVGTDVPVKVIMMPGNSSGAGATAAFPVGINFANGIAIAITAGIADTDATAVGAGDCVVNFDYK